MQAARMVGIAALALGFVVSAPLLAQDKAKGKGEEKEAVTKVLLENDKVRVTETTFEPGAVSKRKRTDRTNYIVTTGTLERTTPDGKTTRYERKAGTAIWLPADSDTVRNVGKTKYVVIGIVHK